VPSCEMSHTANYPTSQAFTSLYVYFNPQHNDAAHKRVANFSVQCWTSNGWMTVLDKNSSAAQEQFAIDPTERSQWIQFNFTNECTSNQWKMGEIHNTGSRVYLFEIKYSLMRAPMPLCTVPALATYTMDSPCLPPPLVPRVQGWCTAHAQTKASGKPHYSPTGDPKDTFKEAQFGNFLLKPKVEGVSMTAKQLLEDPAYQMAPPCASDLAVELSLDKISTRALTMDGYAVLPVLMNVLSRDTGDTLIMQPLDTGASTPQGGPHSTWTEQRVRDMIAPAFMHRCRSSARYEITASLRRSWWQHSAAWKTEGMFKATFWWRPLTEDMDCRVSSAELQFTAEDY